MKQIDITKWFISRFCLLPFLLVGAMALMPTGAAAQSCAAPTDELFHYPDTVLSGITSAEFSMPTAECSQICSKRSGCAGFDHAAKGEVCRLFASIAGARAEAGANAATRALITGYADPTNPPLGKQLEELKNADGGGDQLFELAMTAFGKCDRGVGLEAINLAMQRGSQGAKLEMARWYDPRTFAGDRVAGVDANRAARAYFELAFQGNSEAATLLASICSEAGNSGSSHADAFDNFLRTTYCEGTIDP